MQSLIYPKAMFSGQYSQRKILVLYCHNESDEFGKTVCQDWFMDEALESLLACPNFVVTEYIITREEHRNALIQQLSALTEDNELFSSIRSGESKIYVFVPYLNTILCQAHIDCSSTCIEFSEELLNINELYVDIRNNLEEEAQLDNETQTCKLFQQIMFDKLGNKDFDVFFKNQHTYLKDKIGYAFFGPPSAASGYEKKQKKFIEKVFDTILTQSSKFASAEGMVIISIIYVCCVQFTRNNDVVTIQFEKFNPVPIFILRKCHPGDKPPQRGEYCRTVIDGHLRVYTSWKNFLDENKYPESILCTPKNGEYNCDDKGDVLLEFYYAPACKVGHKVLKGLDITSAVAGVGSGGVLVLAAIPMVTFIAPVVITGALIAGVSTGAYAICRSIANIVDRSSHEQDLSFSDAEARAAYINIAAGALGFVGAGANALLANMVRSGAEIGQGAIITVNTLSGANLAAGGLALGNSVYDVTRSFVVDGERPSALVIVQLGASALFFGNAIYNFHSASTIISEARNNAIQEIRDSLRSNRHRRTFTKMQKETIRLNNGDVAKGNAKVISTMKNANNIDETMAILTRNNKRFNDLGVKFSAQDGHISLNGKTVDITTFSAAINKAQISEVMAIPQNQLAKFASNSSFNVQWTDVGSTFVSVLQSPSVETAAIKILHIFRPYIQRKVMDLVTKVFNPKNAASVHVRNNLSTLGVGVTEITLVVDFLCYIARSTLKLGDVGRGSIRVLQLLVNHYLCGRNISEKIVKECINYATTLLTQKFMAMEIARRERTQIKGTRQLMKCNICIGYYHYNT